MSFTGGYFAYLREHLSDNEIDNIVKVTANSNDGRNETCGEKTFYRTNPSSLIKSDETRFYHSGYGKPAKITFDMHGKFSIKGLALKGSRVCAYLKTYAFQGSNDKTHWNDIIKESNDDLRGNFNWHDYMFDKVTYRYFRIFEDENKSLAGDSGFYFALTGVDFIGSMLKFGKSTCINKMSPAANKYHIVLVLIISSS